jgi:hypothetical protein
VTRRARRPCGQLLLTRTELEKQGVRLCQAAKIAREIVHAAFPEPGWWLPIDGTTSELRWADGVHLDERSALIAARAMEKVLVMRNRGG